MKPSRLAFALLACLGGCGGDSRPATATEEVRAYCGDDYVAVERRIDRLLRQLTLDQKAEITVGALTATPWTVPGVEELGIPPFLMIDGPRGLGKDAGNGTAFPVAMARGATFDPGLEMRIGTAIAREVRAAGRNVLLAPTVNVLRHPLWGRAQETYGEDPFHLGVMGTSFVLGAQTLVPVTVKHFAVNSIENTRHTVDVTVDERTLREIYLPHFRRIVREGRVSSVMSSYNSINGAFASENATLLRDILKEEWGFAGFVVSDWGGTEVNTPSVDHTSRAVNAGLDLEMFVPRIYGPALVLAVAEGRVTEAQVDEMVRRGLRARFCYRLDSNPPVVDPSALETTETRALAREAAERSIVLLENDGVLPIARTASTSIVVVGPLADVENIGDTGSSRVTPTQVVTALEGLVANAAPATVTHVATTNLPADELAIAGADVVVVVAGLTSEDEGEGDIGAGDRDSLALPPEQAQAISEAAALSSNVVVVLEGGSAIAVDDFRDSVEAVVMAWYPGSEGGNAIARVLFGDVNPSGRLPIVFPFDLGDLPPFDNVSNAVTYGYHHGYRHLDQEATTPLYPFGYGLAYTTYAYAGLAIDRLSTGSSSVLRVEVDVTNTGARAGRETVQVYVGKPSSAIAPRAVRDLRGFTQVDLAPGQTQRVTIDIPIDDLGYWNAELDEFQVESGVYTVEVGPSSRTFPLAMDVTISL